MSALLLLCALAQANRTVDRLEKNEYFGPVRECALAEGLIESDPRGAVEKLDLILANPKLQRNLEARIRIQEGAAQFSEWVLFLPYQYRGRARLNLAKKAADPDGALKLAESAVADLEESVRRGVAPSEEFLKTAKADLEKYKAAAAAAGAKPADPLVPSVKEDPAAKLRISLAPLLASNRFKSARAVVDRDGKDVPAAEKKQIAEDVDRRCRTWLNEEMFNFRRRFVRLEDLGEIAQISDGAFDALFALPAPDEVTVVEPTYDWARASRASFKEVQSGKAGAEALLAPAAAAAKLEDPAWFTKTEALAFQGLREGVRGRVERAQNLAKAERERLKGEAEALAARYAKELASGLDAAVAQRHPELKDRTGDLQKLIAGFPAPLAELASLDPEAPLSGKGVEAGLLRLETQLRGLESRPGIAIESRRDLYTQLVAVGALRALLAGKDEDAAATDLRAWGAKLAAAGGPADPARFGPRVEKVFEKLK